MDSTLQGTAEHARPARTAAALHSATAEAGPAADLPALRGAIRRFSERFAALPVECRATCPTCGEVVDARFERAGQQVVLAYNCAACGPRREVHHDRIWTPGESDFPGSATHTHTGARIDPVLRRLPRTVRTLCPECCAVLPGRYFVRAGAVWIEKTCPDHGHVVDCINRDARMYSKAAWWTFEEQPGQTGPHRAGREVCPSDCGLCGRHQSGACLAQIDLTNRCNLNCPVCFANSGAVGYVAEPDYEQIVRQLRTLRELDPPATAVQFTGGEPTIHPDFLRIVSAASDMGYSHIQIATNGIRMADPAFARKAAEAGLHTLYLQFDGVGEEAHMPTRNCPGLWAKKLATIENCRELDLKVCLVPTILRGVNDHRVEEIFRFAVENIDTVSAISYQPVSFSGRIDADERARQRYTLGDLAHDIAAASGASPTRDMYPLSIVLPLAQMLEAFTGDPKVKPSCHPDCAFGTYFLVSPEGRAYPFPQVVDVEGLFWDLNRLAARIRKRGRRTWLDAWRLLRTFRRHFRADQAPPGLTVRRFMRSIQGCVDKNVGRGESERLNYKTLLCAGMHFQDRYNFDIERVKRCVILYSTPAGVFPFCTYNCGPQYRDLVERGYAARTAPGRTDTTREPTSPGESTP